MDERVYEVRVCAKCFTQLVPIDASGIGSCPECDPDGERHPHGILPDSDAATWVRFRCARDRVLKQADPHRSLVERTVYFGCVGEAGHRYWHRGRGGLPYSARGYDVTPWGTAVDGGLPFPKGTSLREGEAHTFHLEDWTALAFVDRSVDTRPGSWSVYCIPAVLDGPEALEVAREAFPPIFARYTFDVTVATG